MKISQRLTLAVLALLISALSTAACHNDTNTAGRPQAERDGTPGSVKASKAGTGDPRVGPR